jgi:hypothetical protein
VKHIGLLLIFALIFLCTCIEYEEKITLNPDGSGTMVVHYKIAESLMRMGDGNELPLPLDKDEIQKELQSDKVVIKNIESYSEEGKRHVVAQLTFSDINDLPPKWVFENRELSMSEQDGYFVYKTVLNMGKTDESSEQEDDMSQMGDEFAKALLSDYTFKFSVEMPTKIVDASPDAKIQENIVTWEFPLSALTKKKELVMTARAKMSLSSPILLWLVIGIIAVVAIVIILRIVLVKRPGQEISEKKVD